MSTNESLKLLNLSESSESKSDTPDLFKPRKKRLKRRTKRPIPSSASPERFFKLKSLFLWSFSILFIIWIVTLTWLAVVFHERLFDLQAAVLSVTAQAQPVPQLLQECHSVSQKLKENQTAVNVQINTFRNQLANFSIQLSGMSAGFAEMQKQLETLSAYLQYPKELESVRDSVGNFGSQIKDLNVDVEKLKGTSQSCESVSANMAKNLTYLSAVVTELKNLTQAPVVVSKQNDEQREELLKLLGQLQSHVGEVNVTVSNKLAWLKNDVDYNKKQFDGLTESFQNVSVKLTSLDSACSASSAELANVKALLSNLSAIVTLLGQRSGNATTLLANLQKKMAEKDANMQSFLSGQQQQPDLKEIAAKQQQQQQPQQQQQQQQQQQLPPILIDSKPSKPSVVSGS